MKAGQIDVRQGLHMLWNSLEMAPKLGSFHKFRRS
jgi:hypothetical protein